MHVHGVIPGDDVRRVTVAFEQPPQLALRDSRQYRWVGDLPAIQMKNRKHRTITDRVEELVRVPAGREWAGLRLAVPDHAEHLEVRVVERRTIGMRERVPELASLVDRSGRRRSVVTRDATGK